MPVPSVTLTGSAISGVTLDNRHVQAVMNLPLTVKLGKKPPAVDFRKRRIHLSDFLDVNQRAQTLPASTNWRSKAAVPIARMYLNDQYGDCVWASNMHLLGVTSANDIDQPAAVQATDQEVYSQYQRVCGPGDNGCVIEDTLTWGVKNGWVAGGQTYKITGYAAVDWTNLNLMKACCQDFGGVKIGINLPSEWTNSSLWDVTNSRIVGGHDVYIVDYDDVAQMFWLCSWGRLYQLTYAAAQSTRWLDEAWVTLAPTWTGPDQKAPSGYDVAGLTAAMARIWAGTLPDDPTTVPPAPPAPPVPPAPPAPPVVPPPVPVPPAYDVTVSGSIPGLIGSHQVTLTGKATPEPARFHGPEVADLALSTGLSWSQWILVIGDVMAIVAAIQAKDQNAITAGVAKLLKDLGLTTP